MRPVCCLPWDGPIPRPVIPPLHARPSTDYWVWKKCSTSGRGAAPGPSPTSNWRIWNPNNVRSIGNVPGPSIRRARRKRPSCGVGSPRVCWKSFGRRRTASRGIGTAAPISAWLSCARDGRGRRSRRCPERADWHPAKRASPSSSRWPAQAGDKGRALSILDRLAEQLPPGGLRTQVEELRGQLRILDRIPGQGAH